MPNDDSVASCNLEWLVHAICERPRGKMKGVESTFLVLRVPRVRKPQDFQVTQRLPLAGSLGVFSADGNLR